MCCKSKVLVATVTHAMLDAFALDVARSYKTAIYLQHAKQEEGHPNLTSILLLKSHTHKNKTLIHEHKKKPQLLMYVM